MRRWRAIDSSAVRKSFGARAKKFHALRLLLGP
jgi:hypothetical protein